MTQGSAGYSCPLHCPDLLGIVVVTQRSALPWRGDGAVKCCRRLSGEEAAASKHALEKVKPEWAVIQRIMEEFISTNAQASPAQGEVWPASLKHAGLLHSGSKVCDGEACFQ